MIPLEMCKYCCFLIFLLLFPYTGNGQNYIGRHKDEVRKMMEENRKGLYLDESSKNTAYNLLKYIDRDDTRTILFVFNDHDTCMYYKAMYDYSLLDQILKELNESYEPSGENIWYFTEGSNRFKVTLEKEDWYFSVLIKKEE